MAIADANGDGTPDVLVINSNTLSLLLGTGGGVLSLQQTTFGTSENVTAIVAGDFTADGNSDVALSSNSGGSGRVMLLVNLPPSIAAAWQ